MSINKPATVESLILTATNPLNKEEDPNIVQSICQTVCSEPGGVQNALRLIVHKMLSPQEKEAMQALLILQACVNNCGSAFHAEIGKFRFLNELIKLVSPKYLGNHTNLSVKSKVIELLYTWTIDLKNESKIAEAYSMLKKQSVVKDDPSYLGLQTGISTKTKITSPTFEDEEKSRTLQRLLQSKRPEDVNKANALIKSMVKEDERRSERISRRSIEVESVLNNVTVLNEMLNNYQAGQIISKSDLDLMEELNSSCSTLCTNIYRIVSEMDDKEEGIGELLRANDELSRVMGRYKLMISNMRKDPNLVVGTQISNGEKRDSRSSVDEEPLLDLGLIGGSPENSSSDLRCSLDLDQINLSSPTQVIKAAVDFEVKTSSIEPSSKSLLNDLDDIFSPSVPATNLIQSELTSAVSMPQPLVPLKSEVVRTDSGSIKPHNPLADLDVIGSSMLLESLPSHVTPMGSQFKPQEKVSLNQIRSQRKEPEQLIEKSILGLNATSLSSNDDDLLFSKPKVVMENQATSNVVSTILPNILNPSIPKPCESISIEQMVETGDDQLLKPDESDLIGVIPVKSVIKTACLDNRLASIDSEKDIVKPVVSVKAQLGQAKSLNDIKVSLENIKPGNQSPLRLIDSGEMSTTLHFTENHPREDVSVVVVSTTSQNSQGVTDYILQAVGPKGCKVRLLPPSSTEMPPFSPFLPPPAITQIMLIANPNQLNVSLKLMLSYSINDESMTDMGETDSLPL